MPSQPSPRKSTYPLADVKAAARAGRLEATNHLLAQVMRDFGFDRDDLLVVFRQLSGRGALRTNLCLIDPAYAEDHYHLRFHGHDIYTHFHLELRPEAGYWIIVSSFKLANPSSGRHP